MSDAEPDQSHQPSRYEGFDREKLCDHLDFWRNKAEERHHLLRSVMTIDREFLTASGSMSQRERYHSFARLMKSDILEQRAALGRHFMADHQLTLDPRVASLDLKAADGFANVDFSDHPLVNAVIDECQSYYMNCRKAGKVFPSKQSLEFVGSSNGPFTEQSAIFKLASDPLILVPVTQYFGMLPILSGFGLTRAPNDTFYRKSSQCLHLDPEDRTQLKVFVYITDVDESSGPFMAVKASQSAPLFDDPFFILDRQDDDVVEGDAITPVHGPAGTMIFCDTCRCLHAGARPGSRERLMLSIEYNIPTYLWAPLYDGDGEARDRLRAINYEGDDETMCALLGKTLVV